jgi:hypothetical protein
VTCTNNRLNQLTGRHAPGVAWPDLRHHAVVAHGTTAERVKSSDPIKREAAPDAHATKGRVHRVKLRSVAAMAAAIPLVLTLGVAITAAAAGTLDTTACLPAAGTPSPGDTTDPVPAARDLSTEQRANARTIYAVGAQLGIPHRGEVIAIATALQESTLINRTVATDHDSLGLFQQRPSKGWGSPAQILNPVYSSTAFYQRLRQVPRWQELPLTQAAQAVQRSAYPNAYAKWETLAMSLATDVGAGIARTIPGNLENCAGTCPELAGNGANATPDAGCVAAATVLARAKTWLTAWGGGPVPYLLSGNSATWFHGYRRDCSGYVSMALGLPGPGLNTAGLAAASTVISKPELRPGDLLINTAPNGAGHVVLFDHWNDASMSSYVGYEQSGDGGTHHRTIPYPYYGTYPMIPYRYGN